MLIVVKLPRGKPPFIGIQYEYEHEAMRTNADLVNELPNGRYRLNIEFQLPVCQITLVSEEHLLIRSYLNIGYAQPEKLLVWLKLVSEKPPASFNLGHVLADGKHNHRLVKTERGKHHVLKIDSLEVTKIEALEECVTRKRERESQQHLRVLMEEVKGKRR